MLTISNTYSIYGGRAQNSKRSGIYAPVRFGGFLLPDLVGSAKNILNNSARLLSCFELPTPYGLREQSSQKGKEEMNIVTFNNQNIELINHNNQLYMTVPQIEGALEFAVKGKAVSNIYNNHKEEFSPEMTTLIKVGRTRQRIFNREGCWLIGMFARTPKAMEFRRWVLEVLGNHQTPQLCDEEVEVWQEIIAKTLACRCQHLIKEEKRKILNQISKLLREETSYD